MVSSALYNLPSSLDPFSDLLVSTLPFAYTCVNTTIDQHWFMQHAEDSQSLYDTASQTFTVLQCEEARFSEYLKASYPSF